MYPLWFRYGGKQPPPILRQAQYTAQPALVFYCWVNFLIRNSQWAVTLLYCGLALVGLVLALAWMLELPGSDWSVVGIPSLLCLGLGRFVIRVEDQPTAHASTIPIDIQKRNDGRNAWSNGRNDAHALCLDWASTPKLGTMEANSQRSPIERPLSH